MSEKLTTNCVTPEFRASYAHVWKKHTDKFGHEKFGISMIFPEDADFSKINKCIQNAFINKYGPNKEDWSKKALNSIAELIMKGDEEHPNDEAYKGSKFFGAKSDTAPSIVKRTSNGLDPIIEESGFYSGCYAMASVNFYIPKNFDRICCALNNLMFTKDGEPLSGGPSAEDDFADFAAGADTSDLDDLLG